MFTSLHLNNLEVTDNIFNVKYHPSIEHFSLYASNLQKSIIFTKWLKSRPNFPQMHFKSFTVE